MKPILVTGTLIPRLLSWVISIGNITLWPFIFSRLPLVDNAISHMHEMIHFVQQEELLVIGFYVVYGWDFLHGLSKGYDAETAYRRIRFEQEAYSNHYNESYLNERIPYAWRLYEV